jgi:hypothetical protein
MDAVLSYLISLGLIAFGVLVVVFAVKTGASSLLVWTLLGLAPVVTGLLSLLSEIRDGKSA